MSNHSFDALYVINQNLSVDRLIEHMKSGGFSDVLVLSTQALFRNEKSRIIDSSEYRNITFATFADYLNDEEMQSCDNEARNVLAGSRFDVGRFMALGVRNKNKLVCYKLLLDYDVKNAFCCDGLGIDFDVWATRSRAEPLQDEEVVQSKFFRGFLIKLRNALTTTIEVNTLIHGEKKYCFLGDTKRLKLTETGRPGHKVYHLFLFLLMKKLGFIRADFYCTTIHNYRKSYANIAEHLYIFVDGFHPSNYPRSYIDSYAENSIFVSREFTDNAWFNEFGKKTMAPMRFIKKEKMSRVSAETEIRNVLLMLNHAGDWTALINRSDTDVLIEAFVTLAQQFRKLKFTIRVHPTMIHPAHEGAGSIDRIHRYLSDLGMENLEVSRNTLEDDLKDNDLIISEYSNAFIDALKQGTLGIIANLTNRRSFMLDYERLGFMNAESRSGLTALLERLQDSPADLVAAQNEAARKYNHQQERFYQDTQLFL